MYPLYQGVDGSHQLAIRLRCQHRRIVARSYARPGRLAPLAQLRDDGADEGKLVHGLDEAACTSMVRSLPAIASSTPLMYLCESVAPKVLASSTYSSITTR